MEIDSITRCIIEATQRRFDECSHDEIVEPPPGKHLRVCLGCGCRLIECDACDAKTFARADISESGWTKGGQIETGVSTHWSRCPRHSNV